MINQNGNEFYLMRLLLLAGVAGLGFGLGFTRTVHSQGYLFSTLCGAGLWGTSDGTNRQAQFNGIMMIARDPGGNLFLSEAYGPTIRKVTPMGSDWVVTTIAGSYYTAGGADGTNRAAQFECPWGIAADQAGNVFVADWGAHTIRKLTPLGTNWVVTTIAGLVDVHGSADGTNSQARFYRPLGLAADADGNLYVADSGNFTIRKLTLFGTNWVVSTLAGKPGVSGNVDGPSDRALFKDLSSLALDTRGNIYIGGVMVIRQMAPQGTNWTVRTIAGRFEDGGGGFQDGTNDVARFGYADGIAADSSGNLCVTDSGYDTIRKISPVGTNWVVTTIGGSPIAIGSTDGWGTTARFYEPRGITLDPAGRLYVADGGNSLVRLGVPQGVPPDNLPPVAQCRMAFVFSGTNGTADASVDEGSFDPDGDPVTIAVSPPGPYPIGTNVVRLIVTDSKGASSSCVSFVHVLDPTPPEIVFDPMRPQLIANGHAGQVVITEVSSNLVNWTRVWTNTIGETSPGFEDATSTGSPKRFYRLRLWP